MLGIDWKTWKVDPSDMVQCKRCLTYVVREDDDPCCAEEAEPEETDG